MPSTRAALGALVLLGTLTGCGGSDEPTTTPSTTPTPTAQSTPDAPASASPSATPRASAAPTSPSDCGSNKAVPDGTWQGRVAMTVRGNNGKGFDDAAGTGRLTLTVADGEVTSGSWTLAWTTHGEAVTETASASIDVTGTVNGSARGTARKPVLPYAWRIKGTAHITRPTVVDSPIDEPGSASTTLAVRSSSCDRVEARFAPTITSKDAAATFTGTATWVATRR